MAEQTAPLTGAEDVAWDLTDLYSGIDDPKIDNDITAADAEAEKLAEDFKGRIAELTVSEMLSLLERYSKLLEQFYQAGSFSQMIWSTNTEDPAYGALMQKIRERGAQVQQKLVFIELEWANTPDDAANALINDPALAKYKHFLEVSRQRKPYLLSEPEERILSEKSVTGRSAWSRFFGEVHGAARYDWQEESVPLEVVLKELYNVDRGQRSAAAGVATVGLNKLIRTTTYIFNTILADKASSDRLRGYPSWITSRNLSNEVDDESVETLIKAVTGRYDIVARYYNLKRDLLGLDELYDYDRYAPLPAADKDYQWDQARDIVLTAYNKFHPRLGEIAGFFFDKNWIDAPIRAGKRGGAYATPTVPTVHPYVFMNFLGKSRDVETLAHELGHGVHMYLSQGQGILQAGTPLTTAETASVFGEMLVFQDLLSKEDDPAVRLAMLTGKIEGSFATVFRQVAMNRFEDAIHTARRHEGELSTDRFNQIWMETQQAMFEDSVKLTDDYSIWWSYIPHFINSPGYVYAYAFGELLVLALYARYEEVGADFADGYIEMLSMGGSDWPHEIVKPLGVDLTDPNFWTHGLKILDDLVVQAEKLAAEVK